MKFNAYRALSMKISVAERSYEAGIVTFALLRLILVVRNELLGLCDVIDPSV